MNLLNQWQDLNEVGSTTIMSIEVIFETIRLALPAEIKPINLTRYAPNKKTRVNFNSQSPNILIYGNAMSISQTISKKDQR